MSKSKRSIPIPKIENRFELELTKEDLKEAETFAIHDHTLYLFSGEGGMRHIEPGWKQWGLTIKAYPRFDQEPEYYLLVSCGRVDIYRIY